MKFFTCRQVLPPVFKFLNESSKKSVDKTSIDMYKFTQTYKLQHQLLSTFGLIARLLKLHEKDLWQILSNTQMYLDTHQHPTLQVMLSEKKYIYVSMLLCKYLWLIIISLI